MLDLQGTYIFLMCYFYSISLRHKNNIDKKDLVLTDCDKLMYRIYTQ